MQPVNAIQHTTCLLLLAIGVTIVKHKLVSLWGPLLAVRLELPVACFCLSDLSCLMHVSACPKSVKMHAAPVLQQLCIGLRKTAF